MIVLRNVCGKSVDIPADSPLLKMRTVQRIVLAHLPFRHHF
nr:MAG TPA: hypothetical protein [Caudoviricetes sp.]